MYLECGRVCNAHGVRGVLKVEHWCDSPSVLAKQSRVFLLSEGEYKERKVLTSSASGQVVLMQIEGICTREDAIAMKGTVLYLKREDIPLRRGAMLIQDMIGLEVRDAADGKIYGYIDDVQDAPRGKLFVIKTEKGNVLLPEVPEFIKHIGDDGMLVTPIPGFFED